MKSTTLAYVLCLFDDEDVVQVINRRSRNIKNVYNVEFNGCPVKLDLNLNLWSWVLYVVVTIFGK